MSRRKDLLRSLASLFAFLCVSLEVFLLIGGGFGQYMETGPNANPDIQLITLNFFPYSLLATVALLLLLYAGWAAGASATDRDWVGPRRLQLGAVGSVLTSIFLLGGLMLNVTFAMQADNILWYKVDSEAYILLATPWFAAVGLWTAAGRIREGVGSEDELPPGL